MSYQNSAKYSPGRGWKCPFCRYCDNLQHSRDQTTDCVINKCLQLEFRFSAWARARPRPDADRGKSRQRVEKMFLYLLKLCRESRIFQFKTSFSISNKLKDERRAGQFPELLIHRSSSTMFKILILVSIQQDGVTNGTVGCVIFIITYFQSLIFY